MGWSQRPVPCPLVVPAMQASQRALLRIKCLAHQAQPVFQLETRGQGQLLLVPMHRGDQWYLGRDGGSAGHVPHM